MQSLFESKQLKTLTLILLLFIGDNCFAQKSNANSSAFPLAKDTTIAKREEKGFLKFFANLFNKDKKKLQADTSHSTKKKNDTIAHNKKVHIKVFDLTKGGIDQTTLYTQGINLNTGVNGFYTLTHAYQSFDALGIPLKAQGTGVMDNGQFQRNYSSFSIDFDAQTYMERLKKKALDEIMNKEAKERAGLGKPSMNLSDSLKQFENVREKLVSPDYQNDVQKATALEKKEEDSLAKNPNMDTADLHKQKQVIAGFEQLEKRYNQLFAIKRNYNKLIGKDSTSLKDTAIRNDEARLEKEKGSLYNPQGLEKTLFANNELSGYEKALMGLKKFSIGLCNPEISEFTLHNFMMKGVDMQYKIGDVSLSAGYGKEQAVIDPYLMTGINVPTYNRTVEFMRAGLGSEQTSNFFATALRISDPGSINTLSETNWIIDISKKIVCSKNLDFEGEVAKSYFQYLPNRSDSNPIPLTSSNTSTLAYALRGHGVIPGLNTSIKVEYANIGGDFITLGNPFLLSGSQMYTGEITQPIGSKFKLGIGGAHINQNLLNSTGSSQKDNWVNFMVAYKPTKKISMELKYSPRQLQQQEGTVVANNVTTNINQLSFTSNINTDLFNRSQYTNVFIGNFQYTMPGNSLFLTQNMNLNYYMVNEVMSLNGSSTLTLSATESRNGWTGSLSQFISQGLYNKAMGKSFTFSLGPQWVEQPGVIANSAGLISSIGKGFGKWGRLSIQLNCRNDMYRPFVMNTAQVIISTNACLMW